MKVTDKYVFFYTNYYSQWYMKAPFTEPITNKVFNCMEQYMMFKKAILFGDIQTGEEIMKSTVPAVHKHLGRKVKNYDDKVWAAKRLQVIVNGTILKFSQNPHILKHLLETHKDKIFVEASPNDLIWGVGLTEDDPLIEDEKNWRGQNLLGKALNAAREEILNTK